MKRQLGLGLAVLLLALTAMTVASASDLPVKGGTVQMVTLAPTPTPTLDPTEPAIRFVPPTEGPSAGTLTPTSAPIPTASDPTPAPVESAPTATATPQPDPSGSLPEVP